MRTQTRTQTLLQTLALSWACMASTAVLAGDLSPVDRLQGLSVLPNGPKVQALGYYDCSPATNGEVYALGLLQPDDIVFDIGAHVGTWTQHARAVQPSIEVYTFEPLPLEFSKLCYNMPDIGVSCHNLALSHTSTMREMVYYSSMPQLSTLHRRHTTEKLISLRPIIIDVPTERLDTFAWEHEIDHIDFVKIDTEGCEWEVLLGAEELLKKGSIGLIQFEYGGCYSDAKTTLQQVYNYLKGHSYEIYRMTPKALIHIKEWQPELENYTLSNYLAVYTPDGC